MSLLAKDNRVYIGNKTSEKIFVVVTPQKDLAILDIMYAIGGLASSVTSIYALFEGGKTILDLFRGLSLSAKAWKGFTVGLNVVGTVTGAYSIQDKIRRYFDEKSIVIPPGEYIQVNEKGVLGRLPISPSGVAALVDGEDLTVLIANASLNRWSFFDTNSDDSWVVTQDFTVRSKRGTVMQEDPSQGVHLYSPFFWIPMFKAEWGGTIGNDDSIKQVAKEDIPGYEADGTPLYLAVVDPKGVRFGSSKGLQPGKYRVGFNDGVQVGYGGKTLSSTGIEDPAILYVSGGTWKPASNGTIPSDAVPSGIEADGITRLYAARGIIDKSLQIGKVRQGFGGALIPYGDKEVLVKEYDVLCAYDPEVKKG